tara:strand:- start:848 stop:979 length:132 start_codon:yes stop_codon:yes gene_type:complete
MSDFEGGIRLLDNVDDEDTDKTDIGLSLVIVADLLVLLLGMLL